MMSEKNSGYKKEMFAWLVSCISLQSDNWNIRNSISYVRFVLFPGKYHSSITMNKKVLSHWDIILSHFVKRANKSKRKG